MSHRHLRFKTFGSIANSWKPLTIVGELCTLDVCGNPGYASVPIGLDLI